MYNIKSPSLSVVICTMNRPPVLREALQSVRHQTRPADEIIISDNSKVRDDNVATEYSDLPIKYHWHGKKLHIEEHWTWALKQASADYILWLEDDNLFRPSHLESMSQLSRKFPDAPLFGTAAICFNEVFSPAQREVFAPVLRANLLTQEPRRITTDIALALYLYGSPIASSAMMVSRTVRDSLDLNRCDCWMPLDRWLWAQFAGEGGLVYSPEITMLYRVHSGQHTHTIKKHRHRSESRIVTQLVLDLMGRKGVDPILATQQLAEEIDDKDCASMALHLAKTRKWLWIRRFAPLLLGNHWRRKLLVNLAGMKVKRLGLFMLNK